MNIKPYIISAALTAPLLAGGDFQIQEPASAPTYQNGAFDRAIRPITSPTLFDSALARTQVNLIFINQSLPRNIDLTGGGSAPLGGDLNVYALQLEYALNERTSIIATKDGYVDFNPDNSLSNEEGFANLGAGIKHSFIYNPEAGFVLSGIFGVEIPTGNSDVFQGEGSGAADIRIAALKLYDKLQLAGSASLHVPFDNSESLTGAINFHASYELSPWFIPVIELSWFRVLDSGDGSFNFSDQGDGFVSENVPFEGGDLINLGTRNSDDNADIINLALGFSTRLSSQTVFSAAYEFPLSDNEQTLLDDRITLSLTHTF